MPDAADRECGKDVEVCAGLSLSVATEGEIDVFAEPSGEGYVPAAPEVGDGMGEIRAPKVVDKVEAEEFSDAYGNEGITCEVAVYLQRIEHGREKTRGAGEGFPVVVDGVDKGCEAVGDDSLEEVTPQHEAGAFGEVIYREILAFLNLREEFVGFADRTGCNLREETDKKCIEEEIALGRNLAAIDLKHVAEGLECEKRYSERYDEGKTRGLPNKSCESKDVGKG